MTRKVSRRTVIQSSGAAGVAGIVALAGCAGDGENTTGGGGGDSDDSGNGTVTSQQETYTMDIATAFQTGISDTHPLMQDTFVENIDEAVGGRVTVNMHPAGELGKGAEIPQKIQEGTIEGGLHSISNWTPFAPEADFINMPYFFGAADYETITQRFSNLVNSDLWDSTVHESVAGKNFVPHSYISAGTRVLGLGKQYSGSTVQTPSDLEGAKIRVSPSDILSKALDLAGANPTSIGWGETPQAVQEGVADGLHVAIGSIYANLPDLLDHITFINLAQSGFIYSLNREWYESLPSDVQDGLDEAGRKTHEANLEQVPTAIENSKSGLQDNDVEIVELESSQLDAWKEAAGYQLSTWDDTKAELAGDNDFQEFIDASRAE